MIYIEKIKTSEDHRCFKKGFIFEPKQLNLLVGDQGTGKSTLLMGIRDQDDWLRFDLSKYTMQHGIETFYFDSESMNPKMASDHNYYNADGTDKGIGLGNKLMTHFESHGETMKKLTVDLLPTAKDYIIMLDEPESALSIRNQYNLVKAIKTALDNNCQIFIATHSLPIIQSFKEVFSLEHNKWMGSNDFIETQK